jgi:hypothetical protein
MCHSETVDYSIGAGFTTSGGPDQKPSHRHRLFRPTIRDKRPIRPYDDEHRGVQRSRALSGFVCSASTAASNRSSSRS